MSEADDLLAELLELIESKNHTLEIGGNGRGITLNGRSFAQSNFNYDTLSHAIPELLEWSGSKARKLADYKGHLFSKLLEKARENRDRPPEFSLDGLHYDSWEKYPVAETEVLVNPNQNRRLILFNRTTREYETVDKRFFDQFILTYVPKDYRPQFSKHTWVKETYCPDLPSGFHQLDDLQKKIYPHLGEAAFNYYRAPDNRLLEAASEPRLHPILKKFFEHFFINEDSRNYMYRWMYTLTHIFHRTTPIVVLCGKAAVGKNTFVENILVGLIGDHNYHKAAQLSERFNASVLNCQLHFFDEGTLEGHAKRNLKGFHELFVAIERKGIDVAAPERIFARFIIATNNRTDIRLDGNDRKFSVPEITDTKLVEVFSPEEQEFLFNFKKDTKTQAEFISWLAANHAHDKPEPPYHGSLFKEICYESLPHWFQTFLSKCRMDEEFTLKQFRKDSDIKNIGVDKIKERLYAYEHENKVKVADVITEGGTTRFVSYLCKGNGV